jgi:hypothetical protein
MIDVERMHNATSSFYFLNGSGGRFGARSGTKIISKVLDDIPAGWNVGMHYNYDTFLNEELFLQQKTELEKIIKRKIISGRAHYLRFDPTKSLDFFNRMGILYDESAGYPDKIGYRCGIAGPFNPYNSDTGEQLDILEFPLVVMDGTLVEQYPYDPVTIVEKMFLHISKIGGALTILFHPGMFNNPEVPETYKLYFDILDIISVIEARATNCILSV